MTRRASSCQPYGATWALAIMALTIAALTSASAIVDARQYSWLGVRIRDLSETEMDDLARRHGVREGFGALITEVIDGAPAASAGLKGGDIVVAVGDRPVVDGRLLQKLVAEAPMDRDVRLTVLRADGRHQVWIRLAPMPRAVAGERVAAEYGFVIRDADGEAERPVSSTPAIAAVMRGSGAEKAGLEVGDVLLTVDDHPVVTRDAAREALADVLPERPLRLMIRRGPRQISLILAPR